MSTTFPYHPDYGLPDDYRRQVVLFALDTCPVRAALKFNLARSTVYKWVKDYKETNHVR